MNYQYFIKITGTPEHTNRGYMRKQLNFELKATTPMEAFALIERYIDVNDFITIGCPRKKGVSAVHPYFVTGKAEIGENGQLNYIWKSN